MVHFGKLLPFSYTIRGLVQFGAQYMCSLSLPACSNVSMESLVFLPFENTFFYKFPNY